jgi:hypothetical protein
MFSFLSAGQPGKVASGSAATWDDPSTFPARDAAQLSTFSWLGDINTTASDKNVAALRKGGRPVILSKGMVER